MYSSSSIVNIEDVDRLLRRVYDNKSINMLDITQMLCPQLIPEINEFIRNKIISDIKTSKKEKYAYEMLELYCNKNENLLDPDSASYPDKGDIQSSDIFDGLSVDSSNLFNPMSLASIDSNDMFDRKSLSLNPNATCNTAEVFNISQGIQSKINPHHKSIESNEILTELASINVPLVARSTSWNVENKINNDTAYSDHFHGNSLDIVDRMLSNIDSSFPPQLIYENSIENKELPDITLIQNEDSFCVSDESYSKIIRKSKVEPSSISSHDSNIVVDYINNESGIVEATSMSSPDTSLLKTHCEVRTIQQTAEPLNQQYATEQKTISVAHPSSSNATSNISTDVANIVNSSLSIFDESKSDLHSPDSGGSLKSSTITSISGIIHESNVQPSSFYLTDNSNESCTSGGQIVNIYSLDLGTSTELNAPVISDSKQCSPAIQTVMGTSTSQVLPNENNSSTVTGYLNNDKYVVPKYATDVKIGSFLLLDKQTENTYAQEKEETLERMSLDMIYAPSINVSSIDSRLIKEQHCSMGINKTSDINKTTQVETLPPSHQSTRSNVPESVFISDQKLIYDVTSLHASSLDGNEIRRESAETTFDKYVKIDYSPNANDSLSSSSRSNDETSFILMSTQTVNQRCEQMLQLALMRFFEDYLCITSFRVLKHAVASTFPLPVFKDIISFDESAFIRFLVKTFTQNDILWLLYSTFRNDLEYNILSHKFYFVYMSVQLTAFNILLVKRPDIRKDCISRRLKTFKQRVHMKFYSNTTKELHQLEQNIKAFLKLETDKRRRQKLVDELLAIKISHIDSNFNTQLSIDHNNEQIGDINKYMEESSSPVLFKILFLGRRCIDYSTTKNFEAADDCIREAYMYTDLVIGCQEVVDLIYRHILFLLRKFEEKPSPCGLDKVVLACQHAMNALENDYDEYWLKIILMRIPYVYDGAAKRNIMKMIEQFRPSRHCIEKAEQVLNHPVLQNLDLRRGMFKSFIRSKLLFEKSILEGDRVYLEESLCDIQYAHKICEREGYAEGGVVKQFLAHVTWCIGSFS